MSRHALTLLSEALDAAPETVDISPHFILLSELEAGPQTPYELTIRLGCTTWELWRVVTLLEREGRVERARTHTGARVIRLI